MKSIELDLSKERKLITALITSDEFCKKIIPLLKPQHLKTSYARLISSWCIEYYEHYKKAPGKNIQNIYRNKRDDIGKNEDGDIVADFLQKLSNDYKAAKPNNVEYSIEQEAIPYLKTRSLEILVEQIQDALQKNDPLAAEQAQANFKPCDKQTIPNRLSGSALLAMDFPEKEYIVPELLRLGTTTLLVAAPKLGKSWFAQQLVIAVAQGGMLFGKYKVEKRYVLYLANEDDPESIHDRFTKLTESSLSYIDVKFEWSRGSQAVADMRVYLEENPQTKLIVIDCLATVRNTKKGHDVYQSDYDEVKLWWQLAKEKQVAILIIHHTRKTLAYSTTTAGDVMEMINGSNGIGGAADQTMVLLRNRGSQDAKLFSLGRAVKDQYLAMHWDDVEGGKGWSIAGDMGKVQLSQERKKILAVMEENGGPMKPGTIAKQVECTQSNVTQIIAHLVEDGYVKRVAYGTYQVSSTNREGTNYDM